MVGQNKPAAEVEVTAALVHELLLDQFPGLSSLTLQEEGSGWDNAVFRLGSDLAVRLPRRAIAAPGSPDRTDLASHDRQPRSVRRSHPGAHR